MLRKNSGADRVSREEFNLPLSQGVIESAENTPLFEELSNEYVRRDKTNHRKVAAEMVERSRAAWHQQLAEEAGVEARTKESQRATFSEMFGANMSLSRSVTDGQITEFIASLRGEVEQARLHYMATADIVSGASLEEIEQARQAYEDQRSQLQVFDGTKEESTHAIEVYQIPHAPIDEIRTEIEQITNPTENSQQDGPEGGVIAFEEIKSASVVEQPTEIDESSIPSVGKVSRLSRGLIKVRKMIKNVPNSIREEGGLNEMINRRLFPGSFRARVGKWHRDARRRFEGQ